MINKPLKDGSPKIIITKDYTNNERVEKNDFAKFIRKKRKEYNDDNGEELSTRDLGEMIGIEYEMFRKILNQEKPTKKRDCIIAICVALQLSSEEIDEALRLYQYMPPLDEHNPRERFIKDYINRNTSISVQALNYRLIQQGFPELDIQNKREGKTKAVETTLTHLHYMVKEVKVRTPIDARYYYDDSYNSCCTAYDPFRYRITGDMILEDPEKKKYIHLIADTEGYRSARIIEGGVLPKIFKSLEETGDYKNYFIELENAINTEKRRFLCILNDTRNYQIRTSARLAGDSICVFTEQFNYTIPELNEYHVLSLSSGHYKLYVYDCSAFMAWYLTKKKYRAYYSAEVPVPKETYDSFEELEELINKAEKNSDAHIYYRMRRNAYRRLKQKVDVLHHKLKNREEFIQKLEDIYNNPADILRYYKLTDDFECKYDNEYGEICGYLDSRLYSLPNGTEITITLDDIYKAFEFGFPDIQEICRLKAKYGSVEAVLN